MPYQYHGTSRNSRRKLEHLLRAAWGNKSLVEAGSSEQMPNSNSKSKSILWNILGWEGFSFVALVGIALGLLAMNEFVKAKVFFCLASLAILIRIVFAAWNRMAPVTSKWTAIVFSIVVVCASLWATLGWIDQRSKSDVHMANVSMQVIRIFGGRPPSAEMYCENTSDYPANNELCMSTIRIVSVEPNGRVLPQIQEETYSSFKDWLRENWPSNEPRTLEPHQTRLAHKDFPPMSPEDAKAIIKRTKTFFVSGLIVWSDQAGDHSKEVCKWVQPPTDLTARLDQLRFPLCDNHNRLLH